MMHNVLIGRGQILHLIPQPTLFTRTLFPHVPHLQLQPRELHLRLCYHGPQFLVLFSPDRELGHDGLEFAMKTACRLIQVVDLPVQTVDAPPQEKKRHQGRRQYQCRKDGQACPKR
jgi:hypothetical protein